MERSLPGRYSNHSRLDSVIIAHPRGSGNWALSAGDSALVALTGRGSHAILHRGAAARISLKQQPTIVEVDVAEPERTIRLDQFIKWQGLADTGGQAKLLIQDGQVLVNGQVETRRSRQLVAGDVVTVAGQSVTVSWGTPAQA